MAIKCDCGGDITLKKGQHGYFGGCTMYKKGCTVTMNFIDFLQEIFLQNGLRVYKWNKICWRCGKRTPVYSYYLDYELVKMNYQAIVPLEPIGLGSIYELDQILLKKYDSIKVHYDNMREVHKIANTCTSCGCMQNRESVVEWPYEILWDYWQEQDMEHYLDDCYGLHDIDMKQDLDRIFTLYKKK